jgi:hypothetical protein
METFTTLVDHAISLKKDYLKYIKRFFYLISTRYSAKVRLIPGVRCRSTRQEVFYKCTMVSSWALPKSKLRPHGIKRDYQYLFYLKEIDTVKRN